ncbi:flagellar assembly protein T N-terminal domain-containing protein [Paraglaciecola sp. L3A3]|uniref:flagellar assembly protein T N-terminal domain-containing protein n=1 Tax=Paraglaciecola sp. L3A3 TaxID=2686358 RepID=UPI00131C3B05|nr:flagellar assembly protein T N-terminal domain-containing protein [Paraglaciecola sp. L3A3]
MLNSFKLVFLFVCVINISFSVAARDIEVKGLGAIIDNNVADARKNAIEDAKRIAVEQLLGSYISARTETNNFMLASEKIYSTAKGQLDRYTIINEKKIDEDTYQVNIKAFIDEQKATTSVNQQLKKYKWYKQPSIAIALASNQGEHALTSYSFFVTELTKNLQKIGFTVIDTAINSSVSPTFIIRSNISAIVAKSQFQGMELSSNQLSISSQLLNAQTGIALSSSAESAKSAGSNSLSAFRKMAVDLSYRVAQRINLDTKVVWLNDTSQTVMIHLLANNTDQLQAMESSLKNLVVGLNGLKIQNKEASKTSFFAQYQGWPEQLYEQLKQLSGDGNVPFEVSVFKGSEISISAKN